MNGRANCIMQVCCRVGSPESKKALADQIEEDLGCNKQESHKHATWIHENFDLAPKGTLQAFKDAIATLAREPQA